MNRGIYESVFLALRRELEEEGYNAHAIEKLVANYSWFLSEYSLLRMLLRSKLTIDECQKSLEFLINRHEEIAREIELKSTVLDIGCGLGILACLLGKKKCRVYGVDIEEQNINVATRLAKILNVSEYCTFLKTDSNALQFNSATFDYIILSWTLHDIKMEEREPLLSECIRILKPSGKLLILDPESQLNFNQLHEMMLKQPVERVKRKIVENIYDHGAITNAILVIYKKKGRV